MEDYGYFTYDTDKMSLQEMIERDINGYNGDLNEDLLVADLDHSLMTSMPDFSSPLTVTASATMAPITNIDNTALLKTLDNSIIFYNGSNLCLSELQNGNINPNLLVNPQTGLPVTLEEQKRDLSQQPITIAVTPTVIKPDPEPESSDVDMLSPTPTTNHSPFSFTNITNLNIPQSPVQTHNTVHTLNTSSPQHSPLHNVHTSQTAFHQTLTQHLLSNNNHHKIVHKDPNEKVFPKPVYSYSCLIAMALKNSETGALPVSEIYSFMTENFPYFKTAPDGWKNSVRHNLSLNKCFEKIENPRANGNTRKGCLWGLNPNKIEKMEEEIVKWRKKDPAAVKRSMSKPDKLEELERGNIGSHAPLPPGLKALRELQLLRLNNAHAGGNSQINGSIMLNSNGSLSFTTTSTMSGEQLNNNHIATTQHQQPSTVTMVTPIYTDNQQTAVSQTIVARTLAQQLVNANVISASAISTQAGSVVGSQPQSPAVSESSQSNGVQVTMVEVVPQNRVQQIKTEPISDAADRKPIVINIRNEPVIKTEIKKEESNDYSDLNGSLSLDPTLSDFALQHWDELASEGINLDELPANLNLSFTTCPSPAALQFAQHQRTSSPLVGLIQANGGTLSSRTISALT